MYDAINKGIKMATGDIIGILNADDVLATDETLAHIAQAFGERETGNGERVDCVYANIRFVRDGTSVEALRTAKTVRYCSAHFWRPWMFRFAAMVPHPSFYVRRLCFERPWQLFARLQDMLRLRVGVALSEARKASFAVSS